MFTCTTLNFDVVLVFYFVIWFFSYCNYKDHHFVLQYIFLQPVIVTEVLSAVRNMGYTRMLMIKQNKQTHEWMHWVHVLQSAYWEVPQFDTLVIWTRYIWPDHWTVDMSPHQCGTGGWATALPWVHFIPEEEEEFYKDKGIGKWSINVCEEKTAKILL